MAGLSEATRSWDLIADRCAPLGPRPAVPAIIATGLRRVAVAAVVATMLLLITGIRVGVSNNISHAPLRFDDAGVAQFAQAMLYQDVAWIVSAAWPLEHWFAGTASLHVVVLAGYLCTVFGCCFALLRMVARLAVPDGLGMATCALLVGVVTLGTGYAFVSGGTIVAGYFTATQIAIALVALSLAWALDGALMVAIALLGLAFDAQAPVAVWGVAGLIGVSVALALDGVPVWRAWLAGGACAVLLAVPAAVGWGRDLASGSGFPGGYVAYLGLGDPSQILAWMVPLQNWVLFGSTLVLGLSAFSVLGSEARAACGAFLGFLVVFACGCALPALTDNAWLLSLRPMAADAFLQLLAAAAAIAVVVRDLRNGGGVLRVALSVAIAACLLLDRNLLPLAALAMLARAAAAHGELLGVERRIRDCNQMVLCRVALAGVVLAAVAGGVLRGGMLLH